jgi:hypothetical protein
MPRILGIDIPNNKRINISLRYIYGIGPHIADSRPAPGPLTWTSTSFRP